MSITAEDFRDMYESKGNKIVRKEGKVKSRVKINPDNILSERAILESFGIDPSEAIFIRGNVVSSKNSKRIFAKNTSKSSWKLHGRAVVPFITDSAATAKYKKDVGPEYQRRVMDFKRIIGGKPLPLYVEFIFIRQTKGVFDFNNMTQAPQDLMSKYGWWDDDDVSNMFCVPPPPPGYRIDKDNSGVIIKLSNIYDNS